MAAGLGADLGKGIEGCAELVHVRLAGTRKVAQREWQVGLHQRIGGFVEALERAGAIFKHSTQSTRIHVLKTQRQRAFNRSTGHRLARQEQRGGAGGTVVVDVNHRDAGHTHLVQRALARGRVAKHIAHIGLLHQLVANARVLQRGAGGVRRHLGVGLVGTGLGEGDHADP